MTKRILISIVVLVVIVLISICFSKCKKHVVNATVLSHHVVSDKGGTAHYKTVIYCDDGYIREVDGLDYFILKEGSHCTWEYYNIDF